MCRARNILQKKGYAMRDIDEATTFFRGATYSLWYSEADIKCNKSSNAPKVYSVLGGRCGGSRPVTVPSFLRRSISSFRGVGHRPCGNRRFRRAVR
ncbi:hypothetical protein BDN70DRAFT_236416 [Pholiota conissans]|uniref:Uncharacterized protein n=1 Tax=Pholiota conissans TaxID=109636 RepID=A0A9P5ZDN7_9AGAR|nr:hypothetical protein BDN70DRAFT_236416 [Pholiota conissans]